MRDKIVAGNWKMNLSHEEAKNLARGIVDNLKNKQFANQVQVVCCPPYPYITSIGEILNSGSFPNLAYGAQNCYSKDSGAFTGEVSPSMLQSLGAKYVILGHSERRQYFKESNKLIREKAKLALENDLKVILCCGEELATRKDGDHLVFVKQQIEETLFFFQKSQVENIVLAYEPIWAIGTGEVATPDQAEEIHGYIRELVANYYDQPTADRLSILYGGSCKPGNANALFSKPNVDGGLIGGASLKANDFCQIIDTLITNA